MPNDDFDFRAPPATRHKSRGTQVVRLALFTIAVTVVSAGSTAAWFTGRVARAAPPQVEPIASQATQAPPAPSASSTVAPPLTPKVTPSPVTALKSDSRQIVLGLRKIDIDVMAGMRTDTFESVFKKLIDGIAPYKSKACEECGSDESLMVATLYARLVAISTGQMTDGKIEPFRAGARRHAEHYGMERETFDKWYANTKSETDLTLTRRAAATIDRRQIVFDLRRIDIEAMTHLRSGKSNQAVEKILERLLPYKNKPANQCGPDESLGVATLYERFIMFQKNLMKEKDLIYFTEAMQSYAAQTGMGEELFKKWQLNVLCETEETLAYRKLKEQLRLK